VPIDARKFSQTQAQIDSRCPAVADFCQLFRYRYKQTTRREQSYMRNLFEAAAATEVKERLAQLRPESERLWGTMNAAQAVAHCSGGLQLAMGEMRPPRMLVGSVIGWIVKPLVLADDKPLRRNSPTVKGLVIQDQRDLGVEQERLRALIDRFAAAGPGGCTTHPHSFFGRLTPEEWATLMYKHLDHHLRQFGV